MKTISYLILFFTLASLFACYSYSGNNNNNNNNTKEGILFFNGTWSEAIKKSSLENKPIFLDIAVDWCGYCKKLKRNTFSDSTVGAYFNANFINVELDGENGEGLILAQKYGVSGYPSLFIINKTESIILRSSGYLNAKEIIQFGKTALMKIN